MFRRKRMIDKIRKMNIRELANLMEGGADLYCPQSIDASVYCTKETCVPCIEKWLKEEAE